jgi:hypothetical protein
LLTPAEFVQQVDPGRPETWEKVEPRIEQHLSVAITGWLPIAFPVEEKLSPPETNLPWVYWHPS